MNKLWTGIFILSLALLMFSSPENALPSIINASSKAVTMSISLIGVYAFWLGILEILSESGFNSKLAKILKPLLKLLFGKQSDETYKQLSLNLSSNILGMGNSSTISAIESMKLMEDGSTYPTRPMIMLMVINTLAFQIVPTTILGLRANAGSANINSIILPSMLTSILSVVVCVSLVFLCDFLFNKRKKKK